jgi:anti-anti-sigma factor
MTTVSVSQHITGVNHDVDCQVAVVRIIGDVDMTTAPALEGAVDELRAAAPRRVVVDLSGVTFASTTLIRFFARMRTAVRRGTPLMASGATPIVRRILEVTGTSEYITLHDYQPAEGRVESIDIAPVP